MADEPLLGRSILVIDDERFLCDMLARALKGAGASVQIATTAAAAQAIVAVETFDLALVDKRLGNDDGVLLIGKLVAARPGMIAVIMTGFASVEDSLAALEAGAAGYLLKPFDSLAEVLKEVGDIIAREERRRRVTVPPPNAVTSGSVRASRPPPEPKPLALPPAQILLALPRDNELALVKRTLEQKGFAVESVASSTEVVQCVFRRSYDVVVVDSELPDGEGVVALERARSVSKRVVLMMVGNAPPLALATRLLRIGQTAFVRRPIDVLEDLVKKIELALSRRRENEARRA